MNSQEYARQFQEKFELYLLALVFTLLGLAVQTAKFGSSDLADTVELLGWASLLCSGVIGLLRLEWVPVAHKNHGNRVQIEEQRDYLVQRANAGMNLHPVVDQPEPVPTQQLVDDRNAEIQRSLAREAEIETSISRKYRFHKWLFILGLFFLVAARGYPVASGLVKRHLTPHCSGLPTAAAELENYVSAGITHA